MKNGKFYFVVGFVVILSFGLLALSYSKESGNSDELVYNDKNSDELRVVFSDTKFVSDELVNFTVTNNKDSENEYSISILLNGALGDVYYSLDGMENKPLVDNEIYVGELKPYGESGDLASHSLELYSKSGVQFEYSISVDDVVLNTLESNIKGSENVYSKENVYRYYGILVNNYIKYEGSIYRIVSLSDDKVKVVGDTSSIIKFNTENNYLSIDDYLGSFGENVTISDAINNSSWLNNGYSYWINGDDVSDRYVVLNIGGLKTSDFGLNYFYRECMNLSSELIVVAGDGSIDNPYEVSYGS